MQAAESEYQTDAGGEEGGTVLISRVKHRAADDDVFLLLSLELALRSNMSVNPGIQRRIAEDIALLHWLGDIPCVPLRGVDRLAHSVHVLPLEVEKELASDFAFLSSIRDEISSITAVAIQEIRGSSLHILVAANATRSGSDGVYLEEVKRGLEAVTDVMAKASSAPRDAHREEMLAKIVRMCRCRIIERLKVRKVNSLANHLTIALEFVQGFKKSERKQAFCHFAMALRSRLHLVTILFASNGNANQQALEESIVVTIKLCNDMINSANAMALLEHDLPSCKGWDPTRAPGIRNVLRKIGRYGTCAERLSRLARRHAALRQVEILCVSLGEASLAYGGTPPGTGTSEATVAKRVAEYRKLPVPDMTILNTKRDQYNPQPRTFSQRFAKARGKDARIHAEVQLVWYLDQHSVMPRPRVIESNKSACFLCSIFITSTGTYITPKSHGRIYEGWRLPSTPLNNIHEKFANDLELHVMLCIQKLIGMKNIAKYRPAPCESSATLERETIQSVLTVESERVQGEVADENDGAVSDGSEDTIRAEGTMTPRASIGGARDAELMPSAAVQTNGSLEVVANQGQRAPPTTPEDAPSAVAWTNIKPGVTTIARPCPKLQVLVEHAGSQRDAQRVIQFRVRQLSLTEAAMRCKDVRVYDVEKDLHLGEEISCGKRCESVLMRLGDQTYVAELEMRG